MDTLARSLAPHFGALWNQAVVVDNRPGASGNLGAGAVARASADGLTLLMAVNTLVINPVLYANMSYDPLRDLAPIGICATGTFLLIAGAGGEDPLARRTRQGGARAARCPRLRIAGSRHRAAPGDGAFQAAGEGLAHAHSLLWNGRRAERGALGRRAAEVPAGARRYGAGRTGQLVPGDRGEKLHCARCDLRRARLPRHRGRPLVRLLADGDSSRDRRGSMATCAASWSYPRSPTRWSRRAWRSRQGRPRRWRRGCAATRCAGRRSSAKPASRPNEMNGTGAERACHSLAPDRRRRKIA